MRSRQDILEPRSFPLLFPRSPTNVNTPDLPYSAELKRKGIHLSALVIPVGLLIVDRPAALLILVPLALFALVCDVASQRIEPVHRFVMRIFRSIMRPSELPPFGEPLVLNGATWMCIAGALCAVFFAAPIAAAVLVMLMVGDGAAAIIGRRFGKHRFPGSDKSWEGSVAFLLTAVLVALPLTLPVLMNSLGHTPLSNLQIGMGALVSTVLEALPIPLNDNVRVPVLAGLAMTFV